MGSTPCISHHITSLVINSFGADTHRHRHRQTDRQTDTHTHTHKHTHTHTHKHTHTHTHTQAYRRPHRNIFKKPWPGVSACSWHMPTLRIMVWLSDK